ncbi:MAG TPA: TonB C-terminal domain-containing protein [Candidatus Binatus sp.]|nr:TonB C-terminal domain-containing protein [Candidatus Binatus sp.]
MSKDARFWRNLTLIALAHIALLVGLIRWSLQAKSSSNAQSIVWIGGAEGGAAEAKSAAPSPAKILSAPAEPTLLKSDEPEDEKPLLTAAKSEIQLPTPKPAPTVTATRKTTPKPKATPKKTVLAKASPKSSPKVKPSLAESGEKEEPADANAEKKKIEKTALVKKGAASNTVSQETSTGVGGRARSGDGTSEFGWYGNMLHDRFYSAWIQPTTSVTSGTKISTLVKVRIEKDGRVSNFEIIKPSENVVVNESVAAIAKRVTQVDPLPAGLGNGDYYDVKINFELSPEQAMAR